MQRSSFVLNHQVHFKMFKGHYGIDTYVLTILVPQIPICVNLLNFKHAQIMFSLFCLVLCFCSNHEQCIHYIHSVFICMHMQWGKLHAKSRVCHIPKEEIKINQILGVCLMDFCVTTANMLRASDQCRHQPYP